jgi:hypothetical protein
MRKLILAALCLVAGALLMAAPAYAQGVTSVCVKSVNSVGNYSCQDVSSSFPLPVSNAVGGAAGSPLFVSVPPYPSGAVPVTASTTGTTASITATLPAAVGKTTYLCGFSAGGSATAVVSGTLTVTGTISGTLNFTENIGTTSVPLAPLSPPIGPCIPASATNTAINVNTLAAGTGGNATVSAWGFQL